MDDVRAVLARVFPGREPSSVTTLHRGNHKRTAVVRFADADDSVVVQLSTVPAALRTEAALARAIRARTAVPTPRLLAAGTVDGRGYLVAEHAPGSDLHEAFTSLPPATRRHVARSFGGFLAALHEAFAFDACGDVRCRATADADDWAADADGRPDSPGEFRAAGPTEWRPWFEAYAEAGVDALPAAFDDLSGPLRSAFASAVTPADPRPRLYPWDLRPGNALVDGGRVSAVLDWGRPLAAPAGLAVAKVEHLVVDWYAPDASLRAAFRNGYAAVRPYPAPTRAERLVAVVRSAVDSAGDVTRPGYPERTGAAAVDFHRRHLQRHLGRHA